MRFHFHGRRRGRPDPSSFIQFGSRDWSFPWGNIHFEHGGGPVDGRSGGFGGPPRGRRRRMFNSEEFQLIILKLIADEPRHGYAIIKALEEMTHGEYAPSAGILYTNLELLDDMGLIERLANAGANKKSFAITEAGSAYLGEREQEIEALLARLGAMRREPRSGDRQLQRALNNLRTAMHNRVHETGLSEESVAAITDILDEATKRIERAK